MFIGVAATIVGSVLIALIVAIARRPKVVVRFREEMNNDGDKVLVCDVANEPVTFWPIAFFGVTRQTVVDVFCFISITRVATRAEVARTDPHMHGPDGAIAPMVVLPAGIATATFEVASMDGEGVTRARDGHSTEEGHKLVRLRPDNYVCEIFLHPGELGIRTLDQEFLVRVDQRRFRWIAPK
ncbi:MAG TPA: hypothetical protein QF624_04530 [Dehalococcoidia bacterium]|nr:hypothetical protein [Dehalococcoidia bacterium]